MTAIVQGGGPVGGDSHSTRGGGAPVGGNSHSTRGGGAPVGGNSQSTGGACRGHCARSAGARHQGALWPWVYQLTQACHDNWPNQ